MRQNVRESVDLSQRDTYGAKNSRQIGLEAPGSYGSAGDINKYLKPAYSVEKLRFRRRSKDCRPSGPSFNFGRGGRRDLVLRATKIVLTELAAIRGSNSQLRLRLARNCDECIFEFFNRIGQKRSLGDREE
jgi:hypothetical protein